MEKEYTVKEIVNLPNDEIDNIQNQINAHNLEVIERSHNNNRINDTDYDYLLDFYTDGMDVYREVYRTVYECFKRPDRTCAFDPATGKTETDINGKPINYGLKAVTPFTCTRLEYVDAYNNPIYVIFPRMKKAERAIEKLESKYNKDYAQECIKAADLVFINEDREAFAEKLCNISKGNTKLNDILRLTITSKYLSGISRINDVLNETCSAKNSRAHINKSKTRNRFKMPLSKNKKRYYDVKMFMHQKTTDGKTLNVEIQLKVQDLYNADIRTHKLYENIRTIEAELATGKDLLEPSEIRQREAKIKILENRVRQINENAIHLYDMRVLDKARRIEDDGYRPLRILPDNEDGTYNQCRQLIKDEYLVEAYDNFDPHAAFSEQDEVNKLCFLRLIGKIDHSFDETAPDAFNTVNNMFTEISMAEKERFNGINEVAVRYQKTVQQKVSRKYKEDMEAETSVSAISTRNNRGR